MLVGVEAREGMGVEFEKEVEVVQQEQVDGMSKREAEKHGQEGIVARRIRDALLDG